MKKLGFTIIALLLAMQCVFAYDFDVIITKSRIQIQCFIVEQNDDTVTYVFLDKDPSLKYTIATSDIEKIYARNVDYALEKRLKQQAEKAKADSIAAVRAEQERIAKEREDSIAALRAAEEQARQAREKAKADSIAMIRAEEERIAKAKADSIAEIEAVAKRETSNQEFKLFMGDSPCSAASPAGSTKNSAQLSASISEEQMKEDEEARLAAEERLIRQMQQVAQEAGMGSSDNEQEALDEIHDAIQETTTNVINIVSVFKSLQDTPPPAPSVYYMTVRNPRNYPCKVVMGGREIGVVQPNKQHRFTISVDMYGKVQLIQASGYLFSPTVRTYTVPKQNNGANITLDM